MQLMEEILHHLGCVNDGIKYQPQLVPDSSINSSKGKSIQVAIVFQVGLLAQLSLNQRVDLDHGFFLHIVPVGRLQTGRRLSSFHPRCCCCCGGGGGGGAFLGSSSFWGIFQFSSLPISWFSVYEEVHSAGITSFLAGGSMNPSKRRCFQSRNGSRWSKHRLDMDINEPAETNMPELKRACRLTNEVCQWETQPQNMSVSWISFQTVPETVTSCHGHQKDCKQMWYFVDMCCHARSTHTRC